MIIEQLRAVVRHNETFVKVKIGVRQKIALCAHSSFLDLEEEKDIKCHKI